MAAVPNKQTNKQVIRTIENNAIPVGKKEK